MSITCWTYSEYLIKGKQTHLHSNNKTTTATVKPWIPQTYDFIRLNNAIKLNNAIGCVPFLRKHNICYFQIIFPALLNGGVSLQAACPFIRSRQSQSSVRGFDVDMIINAETGIKFSFILTEALNVGKGALVCSLCWLKDNVVH